MTIFKYSLDHLCSLQIELYNCSRLSSSCSQLAEPVELNDHVAPACFPGANDDLVNTFPPGQDCIISGEAMFSTKYTHICQYSYTKKKMIHELNIPLLICKGWGSINPEGDEWGPVLKQEYATLWSNKECDHTYHHGWVTDRYICKK